MTKNTSVGVLLDAVDRHDVRMRQARGRPRLSDETRAHPVVARELRRQKLDRHRALEGDVVGEEDDAHAAAAELTLDRVAAGDGVLERPKLRAGGE